MTHNRPFVAAPTSPIFPRSFIESTMPFDKRTQAIEQIASFAPCTGWSEARQQLGLLLPNRSA